MHYSDRSIGSEDGYSIAGLPGDDIAAVPGFRSQRSTYGFLLAGWAIVALVPFYLLVSARQNLFQHWRDAQPVPSFFAGTCDPWVIAVLAGSVAIGLGIFLWRAPVSTRVCALLLLFTCVASCEFLIVRAYYVIENSMVTIQPVLPWKHAIRFALADATVLRRGCVHTTGRNAHSGVVFKVRYGPAKLDTIDLGEGVDPDNAEQWLVAMADYRREALPLPAATAQGVRHDTGCMADMTSGLDEDQAAALRRVLG